MKYFLFLLIPILTACDYSEPKYKEVTVLELTCDENTTRARAEFILQCINNANPKSDEEPEDWIKYCQNMAEDTFCEMKPVTYLKAQYRFDGYWFNVNKKVNN